MGVQEYYYPREAYPTTPSSKLPTLSRTGFSRILYHRATYRLVSLLLRDLERGTEREIAGESERKGKRSTGGWRRQREREKPFPQNPAAHTCLGDLFKRASLKRTRFTFMAIHSLGKEGRPENEPRHNSTQFGTRGGKSDRRGSAA